MRSGLRTTTDSNRSPFPAIGTGIAGFPLKRCAQVMLDEIRSHLNRETTLRRVEIVLFDAPALAVFNETLAQMDRA
jgi:O-acetyl-ADP-ribose deacetylase (regulator of RNase III)